MSTNGPGGLTGLGPSLFDFGGPENFGPCRTLQFVHFPFSTVFFKPIEPTQRKLAAAFLKHRKNCYFKGKTIWPNLRLLQVQTKPNLAFLRIFSKTAQTIFSLFCTEIPDLIPNNFSLWHFFRRKSGKPKILKFYWQRRHGTRLRLINDQEFLIFGPFSDFKPTSPPSIWVNEDLNDGLNCRSYTPTERESEWSFRDCYSPYLVTFYGGCNIYHQSNIFFVFTTPRQRVALKTLNLNFPNFLSPIARQQQNILLTLFHCSLFRELKRVFNSSVDDDVIIIVIVVLFVLVKTLSFFSETYTKKNIINNYKNK